MTWAVRTVSKRRFFLNHLLFQTTGFVLLYVPLTLMLDRALSHETWTRTWFHALFIGGISSLVSTIIQASRVSGGPTAGRIPASYQRAEIRFRGDLALARQIIHCVLQHLGSEVERVDSGAQSRFSAHDTGQQLVVTVVDRTEHEAQIILQSRPRYYLGVVDGTRGAAHITSIVQGLASAQNA